MKHEFLRSQLTIMFGSCPLTDEFIDNKLENCYYAIAGHAECATYMRDELKLPYTEEFQKIREDNR